MPDRLIYHLRVELVNVEPVIWRELYVDENITLRQLHHILQVAFDWELEHPHQFDVKKTRCRDLDVRATSPLPKGYAEISDRKMKLADVGRVGARFTYEYDMDGHHWLHRIRVKQIYANGTRLGRAIVSGGAYNGASELMTPAEYTELVARLRVMDGTPEWRETAERMFKFGSFDPDLCYLRGINAALARLANNGGGKK